MVVAAFEELLQRTIGLDAASIGSAVVERAVRARMRARSMPDWLAYNEFVRSDPEEMQALIEEIVVPETWFFRDREAFRELARFAAQEWFQARPAGVMRLLSLPCSTGEEPSTMAMSLLDAGIPSAQFAIDAVDISARALAVAREAIYGRNSFRGTDLGYRDRHFSAVDARYRVSDEVRAQVVFQEGNLFAPGFQPAAEAYDVIFCRNVLIYFDRAAQDHAVAILSRLLRPDGVVFVAPSETGLMLRHHYRSLGVPRAFGFRPGAGEVRPARARVRRPIAAARVTPRPRALPPPSFVIAPRSPARAAVVAAETDAELAEATRLADAGELAGTAEICASHLRTHGPSAKAFYLLGLVRAAASEPVEAAEFFRKAIYLEPQHEPALLHLAYLLEQGGDAAGAKVLNDRARRAALKRSK